MNKMYNVIDRHGWESVYTLSYNEIKEHYERRIERLENENQNLKKEIDDLKKYNHFLLMGIVRQ